MDTNFPENKNGAKYLQYLMIFLLLAIAFLLPGYWWKSRSKEDMNQKSVQELNQQLSEQISQQSSQQPDRKTSKEKESSRKGTIVLDPGHGGLDSGMVGGSGISEKELNLVYARKLAVLLEQEGYQVVLTRNTEEGLYDETAGNKKAQDMQRRCERIEKEQPLVTISIHQNSYPQDASVRGPQVFYYESSAEGEKLAALIQNCMNEQLEIARPRVQKGNASYYILKKSISTTVLVEMGFLTNPEEEQLLQEEVYQDKAVRAVCDGILQYLEEG